MKTHNMKSRFRKFSIAVAFPVLAGIWLEPSFGAPVVPAAGIVDAANYSNAGISAGEIISIFGTGLSDTTALAGSVPLPTTLGGTSVMLGGVLAPLVYSSPTQINLQVPWSVTGSTTLSVQTSTGSSSTVPLTVLSSQPGIFTTDQSGSGQGAILVANSASIAAPFTTFPSSQPVRHGEFLEIFATGLGSVFNPPPAGAIAPDANSTLMTQPSVTVGGIPAAVVFAGLAPGFVGLYQVNVQIPPSAPSGNTVPVVLNAGANAANTVTVAVDPSTGTMPTCTTESGFNDITGRPIVPFSFTDFRAKVADCGGAQPLTFANLAGHTVVSSFGGETTTFGVTGAGTVANPGTATLTDPTQPGLTVPITWYLETVGFDQYLVETANIGGVSVRDYVAVTLIGGTIGTSGSTYTLKSYEENSTYSDMVRDTGFDGEIFDDFVTMQ